MKDRKMIIVSVAVITAFFILYKVLFIKTVNFEVGGAKIPSQYNVLTGSVKPIEDYKGTGNLAAVKPNIGPGKALTEVEVATARLRWSVFEEWAKGHPEYAGWSESIEIFKKANKEFRDEMKNFGKAGAS